MDEEDCEGIRKEVDTLNYICDRHISSDNIQDITYSMIEPTLYPHQHTLINAMTNYYQQIKTTGIIFKNQTIFGNMGIISDPPGSGKKLAILAFISKLPEYQISNTKELNIHSRRHLYSIIDISSTEICKYFNIIIVSPQLYYEWKMCIEKHTTIDFIAVETFRSLKKIDRNKKASLLLTTSRCFKHVRKYASIENIKWNHVFIDDYIHHIFFKNDFPKDFLFCWLVYNNWIPLVIENVYNMLEHFKGVDNHIHNPLTTILKNNLHQDCKDIFKTINSCVVSDLSNRLVTQIKVHLPRNNDLIGIMILRNSLQFLEKHRHILNPQILNIPCKPSYNLPVSSILKGNQYITPDKIPILYNILSIPQYTMDKLISIVPERKKELSMRKYNENECEICFEKPVYKTMVSCCNHIFCAMCITKQMSIKKVCPICREKIDEKNLYYIDNINIYSNIKTKNDSCVELINNNPGSKFMIYSMFESSLVQIVNTCSSFNPNIFVTYLDSHSLSNNNMLKKFIDHKNTSLLCVSSLDNIKGLSIPCISHIVFLHDIIFHEEKNAIISIAQCLERQNQLTIYYIDGDLY